MIVDEDVECIADDHESESLKVFVWKTSDNDCDAYDAYNRYALRKGFGICKDGLQRFRATKEIMKTYYTCNKEGFKRQEPRQESRDAGNHRETRCGCSMNGDFRNSNLTIGCE